MKLRLVFSLILFILIFVSPFWLYFPLAILGIIYFKNFWEGILLLLFSDFYFGLAEEKFSEISYISFLTAVIVFILSYLIKKKMNLKD